MSKRLLGNRKEGLIFVISAPAGTGKSTLVQLLVNEFPHVIQESCSCTTRPPRPSEIRDQHYHFLTVAEFEAKIAVGEFLEYARVFGNYYGTRIQEVEEVRKSGKHVVLVIDTQGAMKIKGKIDACFIFIAPPSMGELKSRLAKRSTESQEKIEERLAWAEEEMRMSTNYDYYIINDDLALTHQILRSIFIAEEHRKR